MLKGDKLSIYSKLNQICVFRTTIFEFDSVRQMSVHFVNDTLFPTFRQFLIGSQSHHTMTPCSFSLGGKFCTLAVNDNCFCVNATFFAFDSSIRLVNSITQAFQISAELCLDGFKESNRWLQCFKERHILTAQKSS